MDVVKDATKGLIIEVFKTLLFVGMTLGVPIYFVSTKYDLYTAVESAPITNHISAWLFVLAIPTTLIVVLLLRALFRRFKPGVIKRIIWGLMWALPIGMLYLFSKWIAVNIVFIETMLKYWTISLSLSLILAPKYLIDYIQERK